MPRALCWSQGAMLFLLREVPLYLQVLEKVDQHCCDVTRSHVRVHVYTSACVRIYVRVRTYTMFFFLRYTFSLQVLKLVDRHCCDATRRARTCVYTYTPAHVYVYTFVWIRILHPYWV